MIRRRVGIYAGTFDPVHAGHIAFALQALAAAGLDKVYFMPERRPRHKAPEHFGHRVAMLHRAVRPHSRLDVLELPDQYFTVKRTLPALRQRFHGCDLVLLLGSDVVLLLPQWPFVEQLVKHAAFCVGLRQRASVNEVKRIFGDLGVPSENLLVLDSLRAGLSSADIRRSIGERQPMRGLLASVQKYAYEEWLYL